MILDSREEVSLTRIPSLVKMNTSGINKKILFQHFKHGGLKAPNFGREQILNNVMMREVEMENYMALPSEINDRDETLSKSELEKLMYE